MTKEPRTYQGKKEVSSVNGVGENWTAICKRLKLDPNFTSYKNCLHMMTPSYETDLSRDKAPLLSL